MNSHTTRKQTRILVVDDHPLLREALAAKINRQADMVCCGEAGSTLETHQAVKELKPDFLLLDLSLDGGDGLVLIKTLKSALPSLMILVISQLDEALYAERSLRAGASGYIMKEQPSNDILTAIRSVLAGEIYVSPKVAIRVLHRVTEARNDRRGGKAGSLSDRELHVLQLLGTGMTTRKIAEKISLSFKTIESHRENIKRKLDLHDSGELVRYAVDWVRNQSIPNARAFPPEAARFQDSSQQLNG